jgi:hypothetical protein
MVALLITKLQNTNKMTTKNEYSEDNFNKVKLPSFEEYYKDKIESGLIDKDGKPLKCECGNANFERVNCYYEESVGLVEYSLECKNEECLKIVGNWSYGMWDI